MFVAGALDKATQDNQVEVETLVEVYNSRFVDTLVADMEIEDKHVAAAVCMLQEVLSPLLLNSGTSYAHNGSNV